MIEEIVNVWLVMTWLKMGCGDHLQQCKTGLTILGLQKCSAGLTIPDFSNVVQASQFLDSKEFYHSA